MSTSQTYSIILGQHDYRSETPMYINGNAANYQLIIPFEGQSAATAGRITSNSPITITPVR